MPAPAAPPPTAASSTSSSEPEPHVDIDDRDSCVVYSDWLIERGDPLGEIMAARLRGGRPADIQEVGYLARHFPFQHEGQSRVDVRKWKNGLVESLYVSTHLGIDAVKAIGTTRATRSLRELVLFVTGRTRGYLTNDGPPDERERDPHEPSDFPADPIPAMVDYPLPPTLRKLNLYLSLMQADGLPNLPFDLGPLCPQLAALEELSFNTHAVHGFGRLDLPALRSLTTSIYNDEAVRDFARARLPRLEQLRIEWGNWTILPKVELDAPNLDCLVLASQTAPPYDAGFDEVARAPLVRRVRALKFASIEENRVADLIRIAPRLQNEAVHVKLAGNDALANSTLEGILGPRLILEKWP